MSDKDKKTEGELFDSSIDIDELKGITGGWCHFMGSDGAGNCSEVYYVQSCSASVAKGSRCRSDDWCISDEVVYASKSIATTYSSNGNSF